MAEAARRHGISQTSIGKWKDQFLAGGREGLAHGSSAGQPTGREARLVEEVDDLTRAMGEAHVELRAIRRKTRGQQALYAYSAAEFGSPWSRTQRVLASSAGWP